MPKSDEKAKFVFETKLKVDVVIQLHFVSAANVGLSHLNLSWNHLRRKGAHSIANALKVTVTFCLHCKYFYQKCWMLPFSFENVPFYTKVPKISFTPIFLGKLIFENLEFVLEWFR